MHCSSYHFSLLNRQKLFSKSIKPKYSFFPLTLKFSFFHKSELHFTCLNLLPNSVLRDPFHHFHSMFQQFNPSIRSTLHWIIFHFSLSMYSFHESLIPFLSTITLPDTAFRQRCHLGQIRVSLRNHVLHRGTLVQLMMWVHLQIRLNDQKWWRCRLSLSLL